MAYHLGALTLGFGGANALGKQHISVTEIPIGAGFSSPDAEPSNEVHTYIRHLERKIDNLMTVVDRDMHVRGELVEIKRLLQMSPPRSSGGVHRGEHQPRPSAKDRLDPPQERDRVGKTGLHERTLPVT